MRTRTFTVSCLLCSLFCSCYFLGPSPSKRFSTAKKQAPFDAAIVPGLPLKNGKWDTLLKSRIIWSVYLYKQGIVKNIIYSGSAVYTPYTEGKAMALYAQALGVDKEHIFIDTIAEHSTENLFYGYSIAKQHHFNKVALATDPFQCYLLNKFTKKHFANTIYFLPIVDATIRPLMLAEPAIDINTSFVNNFIPLAERASYQQRIRASRGKKLKF